MQNTPLMDCDVVDKDDKELDTMSISGTKDSQKPSLTEINNKVGNYEKFGNIDLVSYYKDNSASTLEFGYLEVYRENENGTFDKTSSLYLANSLRFTNSVQAGDYIYTALVTNEGVGSSLKLTLTSDEKISSKTVNIDDYNFITKAHIFLNEKVTAQNGDTVVSITIIAYSELMQRLTAYKLTVTLIDDAKTPKENSWRVDVDATTDTSSPAYKISNYDYVSKGSTGAINFYVATQDDVPKVGRITYQRTTGKFTNDDPLKTLSFEVDPKNDSQVYGIGCSKIN